MTRVLTSIVVLNIAVAVVAPFATAAPKHGDTEKAYEHRSRAHELENARKYSAALEEYRTAIRFDRQDDEAHWRAGVMELRLGHAKAAIPFLERATRGALEAGGSQEIDLARAYEKVGKFERARRVLEREAAENPSFIRVHLSLVGLLARHDKCGQARDLLSQVEKHPTIGKQDVVSWADDARTDVSAHCPVP
jgi:tetratricopeptide (TPR) repeat protein